MFRTYADINRTVVVSHNDGPSIRRFECDFCDAGWQSETDTFLHRENHAQEMKRWFKRRNHNVCLTCVKKFPTNIAMVKHFKLRHLYSTATAKRIERQIFVCDLCSHVYFNKKMLTAHIFKKHWLMGKSTASKLMFECPKCDANVILPKLWQHFQSHGVMSVSICKICYTKCKDSDNLQKHLSTSHASYCYCDQCSITELNLNNFQAHIELHEKKISDLELNWNQAETKKKILRRWQYPKWRIFDGVNLHGQIQICILCRHMCMDNLEMRNHAASHFIYLKSVQAPTAANLCTLYNCACGETFTSNILRKQHIFKFKEGHGPIENIVEETKDSIEVKQELTDINEIKKKIDKLVTDELLDRIFI